MYDKVKKLADQAGESIMTVEKACGLGNGAISKWKESKPYAENLQKVAAHFGVPLTYFFEEEEGGKT